MKQEEKKQWFSTGDPVVHGKYRINRLIGEGPSCKIYSILFQKNRNPIDRAIKLEKEKTKHGQLITQMNVLKAIFKKDDEKHQYEIGFPKIFEFGTENQINYIVMDLYGPNLGQLLKLCTGKFTMKTTLLIGLQIIDRLEILHSHNYLYIDFKPENFVIGLNKDSPYIIMIDYGRCICYRGKGNQHVHYKNMSYHYDPIFSSINSHMGLHPSRRDDLQSLVYLLVYFFRGRLPWQRAQGKTKKEKDQQIHQFKRKIKTESLIKEMPIQLCDVLEYAKSINYFEKPDYNFIRKKLWHAFETLLSNEEFQPLTVLYDWQLREEVDYQLYREVPGIQFHKVGAQEDSDDEEPQSIEKEEEIQLI